MKTMFALLWVALIASGQSVRIGIVGDQTGSDDLTASYQMLERGITLLRGKKVDAVVHIGDLVESRRSPAEITEDFSRARRILDGLGQPWWLVAGDHDVNPAAFEQNSSDRSKEQLFRKLYGKQMTSELAQSFTVRDYHFILLNSLEFLHSDPRWGNVFLSRISDRQFQWLQADLEAHRRAKGIVVFVHHPLWYNAVGWQRVQELLRRYPVQAVVAGHFHYNQDEGFRDGIRFLVVGPTGATTYFRDASSGGAHHVTVLELSGKEARFEGFGLDGAFPGFQSRGEAERVQAVSMMLSEQYSFNTMNQPCWRGNALENRTIRLEKLGNPTDRPLEIEIGEPAKPFIWLEKAFSTELCRQRTGICPGARTWISNSSSIQMAPGPVWQAELASEGVSKPDFLEFSLTIKIPGDSGAPMQLKRPMKLPVPACKSR
jgi:predicted phosphodiesterase